MCIAILKPAKTRQITDEEMDSCKRNNPDGFGYSFVAYDSDKKENYIIVKKYMKYDEFLADYRADEEYHVNTPFLIHFRMTSAGSNMEENCHPFQINRFQSFMHNGTMFSPAVGEKRSDTNLFNEWVLKELPVGWEENEGIKLLIDKFIGVGKLIILNSDFSYVIFGENRGHWKDGMWWSNYDYKNFRRGQWHNGWNQEGNFYKNANPVSVAKDDDKWKVLKRTVFYKEGMSYTRVKYANGDVVEYPSFQQDKQGNLFEKEDDIKALEHKQGDGTGSDLNDEGAQALIGMDEKPPERHQFECSFCGNPFNILHCHPYTWGSAFYELCDDCYGDFDKLAMM